jgi:hypothetical protein
MDRRLERIRLLARLRIRWSFDLQLRRNERTTEIVRFAQNDGSNSCGLGMRDR